MCHGVDEVVEFVLNFDGVLNRAGNAVDDDVAKLLPEAMHGDFESSVRQIEFSGCFDGGVVVGRSDKPTLQNFKSREFSVRFGLGAKNVDGLLDDGQRPLTIEVGIGRQTAWIGGDQILKVARIILMKRLIERLRRLATSTFAGLATIVLIAEEMLHRSQQIRTEATSRTICFSEAVAFQQLREKLVSQITSIIVISAVAAYKQLDRAVISLAQFAQRLFRLRSFPTRRDYLSPARRMKRIRGAVRHIEKSQRRLEIADVCRN